MDNKIIIGTVRAPKNNDTYVVVTRDGTAIDVAFDGDQKPLIGGDVIGNLRLGQYGEPRLSLKRSLVDALLEGNATIAVNAARPDLTARLLAKYLARSKSAVISPGAGMAIQRMPHSKDIDLQWAMETLSPEADRRQIALNVIDVKTVTSSVWQTSALRDFSLPADIEGSRRSMLELTRVLRSGFHPECSRMVETMTGNRAISVNFVLPYSPFSGALGFARDIAFMSSNHFPTTEMTMSEARRLSSARMISLAMAHGVLGAGRGGEADVDQSARTRHIANCFADALTTLSFLSTGGRPEVVVEYADLRESSICFGFDEGRYQLADDVRENATHLSIRASMTEFQKRKIPFGTDIGELTELAVRIARKTAFPAVQFEADLQGVEEEEMDRAWNAAKRVAFDLRPADKSVVDEESIRYQKELKLLVDEHGDNTLSASRLVMFGGLHVPMRMDKVFNGEMYPLSKKYDSQAAAVTETTPGRSHSLIADRIRLSRAEKAEAKGSLQFGDPMRR